MSATLIFLHLARYVALLLWGMHMVHSGIVRAFGGNLRQALGIGLKNRWKAFLAGVGITALLQSSTATALMSTSFIAGGFITLVPALAVTLGANVGTTLIVQILTFNVAAAAPVFVLAGLIAFNRGAKTRTRDLGRVAIGIGLILLALHLIIATIQPVEQAKTLREFFAMVSGDPIIDVAIAAILTWSAYSSVAVVLLIMTLAAEHIVTPTAALALVLGANLGNIIPQYFAAGTSTAATPLSQAATPNELWCADYKGEFKLGSGRYCYPLTVTDQAPSSSPDNASESRRSTTAFGSSPSSTMIWDTSTWKTETCSPSTTPSVRRCHLCLRYVPSPMSPGRTKIKVVAGARFDRDLICHC